MKKLLGYFFQGLIYLAPLGITIFVLYKTFVVLDELLKPLVTDYFNINIPGLSLLIVFLLVALLGLLGKTIIARPIKRIVNHIVNKVPLIKVVYTSIKDLLTAFVGKEKKFNQPVLVKVNTISNLEKFGFLTQTDVSKLGVSGNKVAVYFPHSYNFSGELFIVPVENVKKIDAPPADVMKFIVSGGVANYDNDKNN
ncbi:MAG: DUF502 domain-containing protein [Bacteroidales bacterium]|nr:DUF502 domain-containing protein [Bacteroidales bacterium]